MPIGKMVDVEDEINKQAEEREAVDPDVGDQSDAWLEIEILVW